MTRIPSLLRYDGRFELPQGLFDDLELRGLMSSYAVEVMRRPCGAAQISERQELFRCLEDEAFWARLHMFHVKLQSFDKLLSLVGKDEGIPALLLRLRILEAYADIGDEAESFCDGGKLLFEVAEYFRGQHEIREQLRAALAQAFECANAWRSSVISVSEKWTLTTDTAPKSYETQLRAAITNCGLSLPDKKKKLDEKLDPDLSRAVSQLFANEIEKIREILRPFEGLLLSEIVGLRREIGFFLEIRDLVRRAEKAEYDICYPRVTEDRHCLVHGLRDAALVDSGRPVVANDTYFEPDESFFFVVGANGGGKTTYLRAVGAALVMFLSGCPIFAEEAEIYPYTKILAHFPADERFVGVGRLDEERGRVEAITADADEDCFYLFNETFGSTDDERGCQLTRELACRMQENKCAGLYVTHFRQAVDKDFQTLAAVVDEADSSIRTYRIRRQRDNLSSYAADILRKYGLDEQTLAKRREQL